MGSPIARRPARVQDSFSGGHLKQVTLQPSSHIFRVFMSAFPRLGSMESPQALLIRPCFSGVRGFAKGWFPKGWFRRMFPRNENRNEGTFAKTTLLRNRPFISQWGVRGTFRSFRIFLRIGFESLISKIWPTGFRLGSLAWPALWNRTFTGGLWLPWADLTWTNVDFCERKLLESNSSGTSSRNALRDFPVKTENEFLGQRTGRFLFLTGG